MKLTLTTGASAVGITSEVQMRDTMFSVYIAPLGSPVLPDVYMIMASR
jgi:hypothetical protein